MIVKKYKRFTIEYGMIIQACLHDKMNYSQISKRLNIHKSTISRKIKRFKVYRPGTFNDCHKKDETLNGICNCCSNIFLS